MEVVRMGIGEWTAAAVATVVGAATALAAAIAGWVVAGVRWRRDDHARRRGQYWERLSWAVDLATREDSRDTALGRAAIEAVYDIPWITEEDRALTDHVLHAMREDRHGCRSTNS